MKIFTGLVIASRTKMVPNPPMAKKPKLKKNNILALRSALGASQAQVAERCVPPTTYQQISRMEKGERGIDTDWLDRLAPALGCEPWEILAPHQQPAPEVVILARSLRALEPEAKETVVRLVDQLASKALR